MKSGATRRKLPARPAEWEAVIAGAPGKDRPLTAKETAAMANAVIVKTGGYAAIRAALAKKRKRVQRGPQRARRKNPEWTQEMIAKARPAKEALPNIFGTRIAAAMLKPR